MSKDTSSTNGRATEIGLTLEQLIRRGARDLLQNAIEVEVRELLNEYDNVRTLSGAAAVVATVTCRHVRFSARWVRSRCACPRYGIARGPG